MDKYIHLVRKRRRERFTLIIILGVSSLSLKQLNIWLRERSRNWWNVVVLQMFDDTLWTDNSRMFRAMSGITGILIGYNSRIPYFLVFTNLQCMVLYVKYAEYYVKKCFLALSNSLKVIYSIVSGFEEKLTFPNCLDYGCSIHSKHFS